MVLASSSHSHSRNVGCRTQLPADFRFFQGYFQVFDIIWPKFQGSHFNKGLMLFNTVQQLRENMKIAIHMKHSF